MKTPYGEITHVGRGENQIELKDTPAIRKLFKNPIETELFFFQRYAVCVGYEGEGRYYHAKKAADLIWNTGRTTFVWHDDLETMLREYCETDEVIVTGPGSYSKTFGAAIFCLLFWLCDTANTGIIACSTTVPGLKRRVWGEIRKLYMSLPDLLKSCGNMVDSLTALQSKKGDMQRGIFGIAVAGGNEQKALGRIIGFHPRRILVIVDELTDVSWSIIDALCNLFTAKQKKQFIGIGNASSIFDSHGKMAEPKDGWNSISVDSSRWETVRGGVCIHFDGFKSPNVLAGKTIYPFLMGQKDIDEIANTSGYDSPQMWRMRRGFWCPEGIVRSVISEPMVHKFRAMEKAVWQTDYKTGATLDPSFEGGDRCVLRKIHWGKDTSGIEVLELKDIVLIKVVVGRKDDPIHYQIARQVKEHCLLWGVSVEHFAMDVTGEGGGLASIISEVWSPGFHQVEFGGAASMMPISAINKKPCREAYYNKVTELWYSFREALTHSQIRGLDPETAVEFCSRTYEEKGKIRLQSKTEMKAMKGGAKSPDLADNAAIAIDLVKHLGGLGGINNNTTKTLSRNWEKLVESFTLDEESAFTHDAFANL